MRSVVPYNKEKTEVIEFVGKHFDLMRRSSDLWIVLGIGHEFYYANDVWYHWHNIKQQKYNVAGKVYAQIPHDAYMKCCGLFEEHDRMVIEEKIVVPSIEIHQYEYFNGWMSVFSETIPIISEEVVAGLVIRAKPLPKHYSKLYQGEKLKYFSHSHDTKMFLCNPIKIPDAYFDTVFLFMLGFKAKQIARIRRVSESTVRNTLVNIRIRFGLDKTKDIIDYAIENQWYSYIPSIFRHHNVSLVSSQLNHVCDDMDFLL